MTGYVSEPPTHHSLPGDLDTSPDLGVVRKRPADRRGTTNRNARGGSEDRRRRREWLVATYRANADVVTVYGQVDPNGTATLLGAGTAACRCYRCGVLLTVDTVTADRIKPGCRGGTYARTNIRPCCLACNSETGGSTRGKR
jgi:hypothetical protein